MIWTVQVDQQDLARLVYALNEEADGKELRRDLVAGLKAAAEPGAIAARGAIVALKSRELSDPGLRDAVAAAVSVQVHLAGKRAGVFVVAGKRGMPRGFVNAPKRLNARKGWRRQIFGTGVWKHQLGKPGWFDDTLAAADPKAERAAKNAMDEVANRIQKRTRN